VFPFDRPLPPAEGDNQALAVNTEDGSVLYDVSFALVWADGDEALNVNEAYALASCQDCRTVAVAFQVVLLVGSVDVVVPQNLSAAVNYACIECVTYALATQLVVSLPGELSADGQEALAAIWAELQEFGENIEDVPLAELRDRLTEFEERILDVVQEHAEDSGETPAEADDPDTGTTDDGTSGTGTDDGTTDGTSDDGATDDGTSDGDPATSTGTDDGSVDGGGTSGSTGSAEPTGTSAPTSSAPAGESTAESPTATESASPTAEATPTG
jgi:putative peptide zinc metalloprotease protein